MRRLEKGYSGLLSSIRCQELRNVGSNLGHAQPHRSPRFTGVQPRPERIKLEITLAHIAMPDHLVDLPDVQPCRLKQ